MREEAGRRRPGCAERLTVELPLGLSYPPPPPAPGATATPCAGDHQPERAGAARLTPLPLRAHLPHRQRGTDRDSIARPSATAAGGRSDSGHGAHRGRRRRRVRLASKDPSAASLVYGGRIAAASTALGTAAIFFIRCKEI
ncbi:MAG: hypothetical protein HS111_12445 [Kofleriaceae bacterium]|nr:hypothetical protein [Kofleriaceae bacterium]